MAGLLVIPFELDVVVLHIICSNVLLDIFLTFIRELLDLRERNVSEEWEHLVVCLIDLEDDRDEDTYRDDQEQDGYDQDDDVSRVEIPDHFVVIRVELVAEIKWGNAQITKPILVYVVDLAETCCAGS